MLKTMRLLLDIAWVELGILCLLVLFAGAVRELLGFLTVLEADRRLPRCSRK